MAHILIINNAEPGIREFSVAIEQIIANNGSTFDYIEYRECSNIEVNRFDGIIMTGSPQGDDIVEHHSPYFRWLKDIKKPVLGICAGHHITGYLYGSKILRSIEPETGDFEVKLTKRDPIFRGLPDFIKVKQMHNDSVTLPKNFILLATSENCHNQMMKHNFKPLYTTQFHPEFHNHDLIRNFILLCENYSLQNQ